MFRMLHMTELTILEAGRQMASGEQSAERLTQIYLERIAKYDPALKSVLEINPEALKMARVTDAERKKGRVRSPLHGIPVLIKDNISTADQMQTTAGSRALLGHIAQKDAEIVRRLR